MKADMNVSAQSVILCKNTLMSLYECINLVVSQCYLPIKQNQKIRQYFDKRHVPLYNLINKSLQGCMSLSVSLSVSLTPSLSLAALLYWGSGAASIALNCSSLPPLTGYLSESCAQHYSHIDVIYLSHTHAHTTGITPTNSVSLWERCRIG